MSSEEERVNPEPENKEEDKDVLEAEKQEKIADSKAKKAQHELAEQMAKDDIKDIKDVKRLKAKYEAGVEELSELKSEVVEKDKQLNQKIIDTERRKEYIDGEYRQKAQKLFQTLQQKNKYLTLIADDMALLIINAPHQTMTRSFQLQLIGYLKDLFTAIGMRIEVNEYGAYVPQRDREFENTPTELIPDEILQAKAKQVEIPKAVSEGELPANCRKAYEIMQSVCERCRQETDMVVKQPYSKTIIAMHKMKRELDSKIDEYLDVEFLREEFHNVVKVLMVTAEQCQSLLDKQDSYGAWADWLIKVAKRVEELLDIGVVEYSGRG